MSGMRMGCARRCNPCVPRCYGAVRAASVYRGELERLLLCQPEPWEPEYPRWARRFEDARALHEQCLLEIELIHELEGYQLQPWREMQGTAHQDPTVFH